MSTPLTIEAQLMALVEQHDLTCLSITVYPAGSGFSAHFDSSAQGGGKCAFAETGVADTLSARITSAIDQLGKKRSMAAAVGDLAIMEPVA
jgi:hypothetical protein